MRSGKCKRCGDTYTYDDYGPGKECSCGKPKPGVSEGEMKTKDINIPEALIGLAVVCLDRLSEEDRLAVFQQYCTECGTKNPNCQCWNDE